MAIDFKLPDLGENIASADIGQILVKEGDVIQAEQVVLELETEKAVFELPCPHAGKVVKIHVKEGQTVQVGSTILTIDAVGAGATAAAPAKPSAPAKSAPTPPPAAKAAPTKPSAPAPKPPAPEVKRAMPARPPAAAPPATPPPAVVAAADEGLTLSSLPPSEPVLPAAAGPATRRLARELGVDLHKVNGTGPGGRITVEDVQAHVRQIVAGTATAVAGAVAPPPLPDFNQYGPTERKPMNRIAKTAMANLSLAWQMIPHVTQHELADITDLETGRKKYMQALGESSPKITMTVLALKAAVAALKAFPQFNASLDHTAGEIILKQYYHIGVAVDTEHGLLVPIVRDVDKKSIVELAAEVNHLANKARSRKVDLADLRGGTFTISNLGGIGGTAFTPIVNYPEVAILGMSRARWQPVLGEGGQQKMRLLLPLSLSYDHRVINGADGARFTTKLAGLLSDPIELLIEG